MGNALRDCVVKPLSNQSNERVWRHRPGNYKAPLKSDRDSFCFLQKALSVLCPCLFIVVCQSPLYITNYIYGKQARKQVYRRCVVPCSRYTGGDTHQLLFCCLGVEHAWSQFSRKLTVGIARRCPRGRSAPAGRSPRRTVRFAFPARVSLLPRHGGFVLKRKSTNQLKILRERRGRRLSFQWISSYLCWIKRSF